MPPLEFGWFIPSSGDSEAFGVPEATIDIDEEHLRRVTMAAEHGGDLQAGVPLAVAEEEELLLDGERPALVLCPRLHRVAQVGDFDGGCEEEPVDRARVGMAETPRLCRRLSIESIGAAVTSTRRLRPSTPHHRRGARAVSVDKRPGGLRLGVEHRDEVKVLLEVGHEDELRHELAELDEVVARPLAGKVVLHEERERRREMVALQRRLVVVEDGELRVDLRLERVARARVHKVVRRRREERGDHL